MYQKYFKRVLDIFCALAALIVFCWLYAFIAILVRLKLGSPVIFKQERPGKDEKLFTLYKFRTMTDAKDKNGNLLPDSVRLTKFGKLLRSTSLDELPEAWNILKGDMSVVGPRPLLVKDMVFMTLKQRQRHTIRPGLSGLAQVSGRNAIAWEVKLLKDLEYLKSISFLGDVKIILKTIKQSIQREDICADGMYTAEDFGDYLLRIGAVDICIYEARQAEANTVIANTSVHKV